MNYYPPPGQPGYPQQGAPQGYQQQGYQQPQQMQQQAAYNAVQLSMMAPRTTGGSRSPKAPDGYYVARTAKAEVKQVSGGLKDILTFEYVVHDSTVQQVIGQMFEHAFFMTQAWNIDQICDFGKLIWGEEAMAAWAQQQAGIDIKMIANAIAADLQANPRYLAFRVARSQKNDGSEPFANHYFDTSSLQPMTVQEAQQLSNNSQPSMQQMVQQAAAQQAPQGGIGQPPQQPGPGGPPQPQQQYQQAPQQPQQYPPQPGGPPQPQQPGPGGPPGYGGPPQPGPGGPPQPGPGGPPGLPPVA